MSDLLSDSSSHFHKGSDSHAFVLSSDGSGTVVNIDKLFEDAESIKDELKVLESLHQRLQSCHEQMKTLHNTRAVKDLRAWMEWDVDEALKKAMVVNTRLEDLDQAKAANQSLPGCWPGLSSDRIRTSVVDGLRKKLKDNMEGFNKLREKLSSENKETVERRYFPVTGEDPDEGMVNILISTGESETFLQKAIQGQGRGGVLDPIQERHNPAKDMERNLKHSRRLLFLFSTVLVLIVLLMALFTMKPWV